MRFINDKPIIIWYRGEIYSAFDWQQAHQVLPTGFKIAWAYDQSESEQIRMRGYLRKSPDRDQTTWYSCTKEDYPNDFRAWLLVQGLPS